MLINAAKAKPDYHDPETTFLIFATTDGGENSSSEWKHKLAEEIRALTKTDRWTFVFRVPRGYARELTKFGIPEGNILEWDQTTRGVEVSTQASSQAVAQFYTARKTGVRSTKTFYSNLKDVKPSEIKASLDDITREVKIWNVPPKDNEIQIRDFINAQGISYTKGKAFYQLTKREKEVQDYKKIVIKDKKAGKTYGGDAARDILGLPRYGTVPVSPGDHGGYDIYIQSTSVNRKLPAGTRVLYWITA